jgi:beta-barrel assembly-enhancing protease
MALVPLLIGAAPIRDDSLAALQAADARVAAVAWRLQTASGALCDRVVALPGFTINTAAQYAPADRARVAAALGLGARPTIVAVVPHSSAANAGMQVGDIVVAINGARTTDTLPPRASYAPVERVEAMIVAGLATPPLALSILRGGRVMAMRIAGDRGCASQVQIVPGTALGGLADGRYVQLTGATIDFVADDADLAAIMAHELAHNFLRHRARLDAAGVSRGIFAGMGQGGAALRATEYEADRLSVWIMARAGYRLDGVVAFWTRWGKARGDFGILSDGTHPRWADRIARIAVAVAQAKAQIAAGKPLIPPPVSVTTQ